MAVRETIQIGHPLLRKVAAPVADPGAPEVAALLEDLSDTLADWRARTGYGRGIAAPQIGVPKRVVFVRVPGQEPVAMVNPEIIWASDDTFTVWDACLSYFVLFFQVERHCRIRVKYQDQHSVEHVIDAVDDLAELLQHELDHLDGRLAIDLVTDPHTFCTVAEYQRRYEQPTA